VGGRRWVGVGSAVAAKRRRCRTTGPNPETDDRVGGSDAARGAAGGSVCPPAGPAVARGRCHRRRRRGPRFEAVDAVVGKARKEQRPAFGASRTLAGCQRATAARHGTGRRRGRPLPGALGIGVAKDAEARDSDGRSIRKTNRTYSMPAKEAGYGPSTQPARRAWPDLIPWTLPRTIDGSKSQVIATKTP